MGYNDESTSVPRKEKSTKSLTASSLLLPQHCRCRHHHLEEALLSHLPMGDPSSPKEAGELRSPEKRSERPISGRS